MKLARKFFKKAVQGWRSISHKELKEVTTSTIPQKNEKEIGQAKIVPIISPVPMPTQVPLVEEKTVVEKKYEEEEKTEIEGITIPRQLKVVPSPPVTQQPGEISVSYPLIPRNPKQGEKVFASVKIYWDKRRQSYFYEVVEPKLDERMKEIVKRIKELLEERLDVDLSKLNLTKAKEYLKMHIDEIVRYFKFRLTEEEVEAVRYYVERDFLGLGKIEAIMKDPNIEDISCDGVNIPVFVFHRDARLGSIPTNIVFEDPEELDSFIIKLAQLAGKSISINEPLVNGTLPDGSRLQATLATDIARRGSNFTIRKFMEEPLTPIHLIKYGTADERVLAYIWLAVDYGRSILIAGGTASGKTTMLNVLSLFIRPDKKIISIEDTAEIVLPHPHWVSHVARTPISTGKEGEVDLFQLLKESLRQRPDYIVLGEVRGQEAYVLFQQMASIPAYENVIVLNHKCFKQIPISKLKMKEKIQTFAINPLTERVEIFPVEAKVSHGLVERIYKITTKTGREVLVTPYHSLFIYKNGLVPIFVSNLKRGDKIVIPAKMPCGFNNKSYLNLLELFPDIRVYSPKLIRKATKKLGFDKASKICKVATISNYYGVNNCALPLSKFKRLIKKAKIRYTLDEIKVRFERNSSLFPAKLPITPYFLRLVGYYISEGSLNRAKKNNSIALYNKNPKILADMKECIIRVTGKIPKERKCKGWGEAYELRFNHKIIFEFFRRFCGATSKKKRIPEFIFGLSKSRIGEFLSALYAGDGSLKKYKYSYYTSSKKLANDLLLLLLTLGIVGRLKKRRRKKIEYEVCFYRKDYQERFLRYVRCIGSIPEVRIAGRKKDTKDIFLDEIESIQEIKLYKPVEVYDLSVQGAQNFIGGNGGILLHNTGHPSFSTIHAENFKKLIDRLTSPPISLPEGLIGSLDIVVFMQRVRYKERFVRRVTEVAEIVGVRKGKMPIVNYAFRWDPFKDSFEIGEKSAILKKISQLTGLSEKDVINEFQRRVAILRWMKEKDITNFKEVYTIISAYYSMPNRVLALVESG
jgi:flagellar protein FlaI